MSTLEDLILLAGQPDWDLILIGDGSGTTWANSAGWATVCISRDTGQRTVLFAGYSHATVNFVELEAYIHTLRWDFNSRWNGKAPVRQRVLIFSDSESTVRTGNGAHRPSANLDLWNSLQFYRQQGYEIWFFHIPRNVYPLHVLMDVTSRSLRLAAEHVEGVEAVARQLQPRTDTRV